MVTDKFWNTHTQRVRAMNVIFALKSEIISQQKNGLIQYGRLSDREKTLSNPLKSFT